MEETNKSRNQQKGNNKMLIKIGGGGGGGIGAVVLFGGALATAAFASVFVLGQKRRSSGKDRRHNLSPKINEKSEKDEDQTFREHESDGAKEETEMEKDSTVVIAAHSLKEDDEKQGDLKAREVEDNAVSVDGFVVVKDGIPLLAEKDEIQLIKEDVSDDFSKESRNPEQVSVEDEIAERVSEGDGDMEAIRADEDIEGVKIDEINDDKNVSMEGKMEERELGGFCDGNGEISEEKVVIPEAVDRAAVDFNGDGIIVCEKHNADGEELLLLSAAVEMDESSAVVGCIAETTVKGCIVNVWNGENGGVGECLEVGGKMKGEKEGMGSVENEEAPDLGLNENGKEERLVGGGESAAWQAEHWAKASPQQVKVMRYEVGGKIEEDMKGSSFLEKYEVGEMGTVKKDHTTTRRGMIMIWMVSVVSSLSCSWFFDFSCAKMCLVVFLTVFLLEIYGCSLVNRNPDRCLHAVK